MVQDARLDPVDMAGATTPLLRVIANNPRLVGASALVELVSLAGLYLMVSCVANACGAP